MSRISQDFTWSSCKLLKYLNSEDNDLFNEQLGVAVQRLLDAVWPRRVC